ncbi:MAG: hypothetical protein ABW123_05180 [Cystobacter sp.]
MAKHRLILSHSNKYYPVRSEAGQLQATRVLVVTGTGRWTPEDRPELYLVVAPGDELEFALESPQHPGGSVWLFKKTPAVLLPKTDTQQQEAWERVDIESGSRILQVNPALTRDSGECRYDLRISALNQRPLIIVGQGQAGSLTATRP